VLCFENFELVKTQPRTLPRKSAYQLETSIVQLLVLQFETVRPRPAWGEAGARSQAALLRLNFFEVVHSFCGDSYMINYMKNTIWI